MSEEDRCELTVDVGATELLAAMRDVAEASLLFEEGVPLLAQYEGEHIEVRTITEWSPEFFVTGHLEEVRNERSTVYLLAQEFQLAIKRLGYDDPTWKIESDHHGRIVLRLYQRDATTIFARCDRGARA